MKSLVIFFLFFFPYVICNAQSDCTNDTTMYLVAYNYIINDSTNQGKSISVSDSIIDLDRFWFSEDLIALPMEKVKLDKYRANKGYVWFFILHVLLCCLAIILSIKTMYYSFQR